MPLLQPAALMSCTGLRMMLQEVSWAVLARLWIRLVSTDWAS
jgi:hypothetical protein